MQRRLAAIMAVDVVGYSGLMEHDETGTLERLKTFRRAVFEPAVRDHAGRIFKLTGDGAFAEFPSVVEAVRCALAVQGRSACGEGAEGEASPLQLRAGVTLGDVMAEDGDLYGNGVNVAARLEALAEPGGLCVSGSALDHLDGATAAMFADMGEQRVKNLARPIRVWRWTKAPRNAVLAAGERGTTAAAPAHVEAPSVAVLPFVNMSERQDYAFLADGLTEDLITLLARIPGFLVIARSSSFRYRGPAPDLREIGRELGVRYVVQGSLRPMGETLRINALLVEAESGRQLWAERFDRAADVIFDVQDQITYAIIGRLEPALAQAEVRLIKRRPPASLDAWAFYQQASGLLSLKGWHRETFEEATGLLNDAVKLDPEFALAHAYLSLILALGHMFNMSPRQAAPDPESLAIQAAERAIELDGSSSAVLGYAGCALSDIGHVRRGVTLLERAVDSDPSNAQAWVALGIALIRDGKARKGVEMLRHGMRISPIDNRLAFWGATLAYTLFRLGDLTAAREEALRACRRDDKLYMARVVLATILAQEGQMVEARAAIDDALRVRPDLRARDVGSLVGRRGVQILLRCGLLP